MSVDLRNTKYFFQENAVANLRSGTAFDVALGLDEQLNVGMPGSFAAVSATNTAFYGERQQFQWTSIGPSFNHAATAGDPLASSCIGDSQVIADPDVNTGAVAVDAAGKVFTVGPVLPGIIWVRAVGDMDNTGGGSAEWDFFLLKNGASVAGVHRTEWTVLANRTSVTLDFKWITIAATDEICFAGLPSVGSETLIIRKWIPQFTPVRQA